jgi:hypothetical protein
VIALVRQGQQCLRDRADPGGAYQAVVATLQLGERQLQRSRSRVGAAQVEKSRPLPAQRAQRIVHRLEFEFDRLVDRGHYRTIAGGHVDHRWMIQARGFLHDSVLEGAGTK